VTSDSHYSAPDLSRVVSVFIENERGPPVSIGWVLGEADLATRLKSGAIRQQGLATPPARRDFRPTGLETNPTGIRSASLPDLFPNREDQGRIVPVPLVTEAKGQRFR
jgi:hypothetical protein